VPLCAFLIYFDLSKKKRCALDVPSGDEIPRQIEGMVFGDESVGKARTDNEQKQKKQKKSTLTEQQGQTNNVLWKKKSIFFRLPY
jgi:hypothetical protein